MTEQERINSDVQMKLALQDAKFNAFVDEMRDFKEEMRQQNQMRAEDIREMRQNMKDVQKSMQDMHNLNVVTLLGIAAIVVAVLLK